MKFLDVRGNTINDIDEFIRQYGICYFYRNAYKKEEDILKLLGKEEYCEEDIASILSWKIGNSVCEDKDKRLYVNSRSGKVYVKEIDNILKKHNTGTAIDNDEAYKFFNELCKLKNIGAVYAVSILFFISGGNYPIYDRFARMALSAIKGDSSLLGEKICGEELSWNKYLVYINDLTELFEERWKKDRDVDRALWAYGHMFTDK